MPFPRATIPVNPFTINHSQREVDDMKTLLRLSPLGPDTYENSSIHNHKFGPSKAWMEDMKRSWLEFDWSAAQTKLNEFPQFIADVKDVDPLTGKEDVFKVHFVGIENEDPEAIPVVIMHGWPGNFNEILPLVPYLLTTPNPPMHIIIPSLIGYSYSSPAPLDREFGIEGCARVLNSLMLGLGYDRYVAQGGDLGAFLGRYMAIRFEACHFNFIPERGPSSIIGHLTTPFLSESDKHGLERSEWFVKDGYAYNQEQATRPATIGFTVGSSPVGLLAWVGEKLLHWTDTTPSRTHILTWLSLYWLTRSYPTSIYPYRSPFQKLGLSTHPGPASDTRDLTKELKGAYVDKMMGYSKFPYELIPTPESWAGRTGNMVFFREHDVGGHFAATEQPELLAGDFVQFLKIVWPGAKEKSGSGSGSGNGSGSVGGSSL